MQPQTDQETAQISGHLDSALKGLWERTRLASALIATLQEQKVSLHQRIDELETALSQVRQEYLSKDMEIIQLRAEVERLTNHPVIKENFLPEEKLELKEKIKVMIGKIDHYVK